MAAFDENPDTGKIYFKLTLTPPNTTKVPHANSLDLDETLSNSASHPDSNCLTLRKHFHHLSDIEEHWKLKQKRNLADFNLFAILF